MFRKDFIEIIRKMVSINSVVVLIASKLEK